jgi:hypothetical protein
VEYRELTGIMEDGGRPYSGVPFDARRTLRLNSQDEATVSVRLVTRSGVIVRLDFAHDRASLFIRQTPTGRLLAEIDGSADPELVDRVSFVVPPLGLLGPRRLLYEIQVRYLGADIPVVPTSPLLLE